MLAAEQGNAFAQHQLGFMIAVGQGVQGDLIRGHMWLNIAASLGDSDAANSRDTIEEDISPARLAEAQKLARRCVARNYKGC